MTTDNSAYRARYGSWAGYRAGHPPDYAKCCASVTGTDRAAIPHQCQRKRGYGPGEAYCAMHDPERKAADEAKRHAEYIIQSNRRRYDYNGRKFHAVLVEIAEGHADPRALAAATLAEFVAGEYK